jgi:glucose/arabinose dehydrogenase
MRSASIFAAFLWALLTVGTAPAPAATLQPIGSFAGAIYLTSDPGNPERIFVVDRSGRIAQHENGVTSTFANLESVVSCCGVEDGLLSIALAPDFDRSGRLYVDYIGKEEPGEIHVAELRQGIGATAPISSLRQVLKIPHPGESNHFGGQLQFGPDGHLYISTGDGGGSNDPHHNAQNRGSLLGKILRIDPLPSGVLPYTVPADNPFVAQVGARPEIWSYGLRNPFRFSFDRLGGDLTIGDVGQTAREEIDYAAAPAGGAGVNFGWSCREGFVATPGPVADPDPACAGKSQSDFTDPVFDFPHTAFSAGGIDPCAVIGGYVVRDPSLEDLYGRYLYGDYCSGELRSLDFADPVASDRSEGIEVSQLDSFGEDSCGRVYTVSRNGGVARLAGARPRSCAIPLTQPPSPTVTPQPRVSHVGIEAENRRVERGRRVTIVAWVSPCEGHRGELVKLRRGRQRLGTRYLNRVCSVRFRPRLRRKSVFRAEIAANREFLAATSRNLRIAPTHRHHRSQ